MATNKIVIDAHIEIELNMPYYFERDIEKRAKRLESDANDLLYFIRDHKSVDVHDIYVVREYGYKCEHCFYVYDHDEERPECCEKAILEWATEQELIDMGLK